MRLVGTDSREKHAAEPVQFGMPFAKSGSFDYCFCLQNRLKSFGGTIREVQSFFLFDIAKPLWYFWLLGTNLHGTQSNKPICLKCSSPRT
jgi:hypothetical protein